MNRGASALALAVALAGAAAACGEGGPPAAMPSAPTAVVAQPFTPRMPFPGRGRLDAAVTQNAACERCHADVAASWRASLHHRADVEPAYRRSFAIEPLPFCRSCHAPEADPLEEESPAVAELGVGCVTCHVTDSDAVLAAPRELAKETAPHPVQRVAAFAGVGACANCHEFAFPGQQRRGPDSLMQSTVSEHAASPAASRPCAACHMPRDASGRRSHDFTASRSAEAVRRAASVRAERVDATRVRIALTPVDPGHAFPTGDLFRRLELTAELSGPDHMRLGGVTRYLTRHWGFRPSKAGRELKLDDRIAFEPSVIELDLGAELTEVARTHEIVWRVAYQRVAHPNGIEETNAEIDGELEVASGLLPPIGFARDHSVSR